MADPISITSLIVDVSTIVSSLINYAKAVRSAASDTRKLSEELFALKGILEHLSAHVEPQRQYSKSEASAPPYPEVLATALQTTNEYLRSLLTDLEEPATKFRRLKQKLEWPFTQEQFNTHLIRLERVKSWLILVLTTDSTTLGRDMHREINSLARSLEEDLQVRNQERIQVANRDLFRWLAPVHPGNTHLRASKAHLGVGSGKWFIDGDLKDWLKDDRKHERILFLVGKSGAGKTTLFAQTVDELTSMSSRRPNFCFAYFYCTFGDTASHDPRNILGSVIAQLSGTTPSILERVRSLYEATPKNQAHREAVDITVLEDAIIKTSCGQTRVVLLIDAINESSHMGHITRSLSRLRDLSTNLLIFVTSTTDMIAPDRTKIVDMKAESIRGDIEAFIHSRFEQNETLRNLSTNLKAEIRRTLLTNADGSFRWAQLSLDSLSEQRTVRAIRDALRKLPGTLREMYANILERIAPNDWVFVRKALFWLSFAKRPLTLSELNEAVVLEETCTVFDEDTMLVSPQILLQISQGLITQDRSGSVNLAHSSIKDFLTSEWIHSSRVRYFRMDPSTADQIIMRQCLTYLCLDNFRLGYVSPTDQVPHHREQHPFLGYAAQYWGVHGHSCELGDPEKHLVNQLFDTRHLPRRGNFGVWLQTLVPEMDVADIEVKQPLYYAASFGLVSVVKALLASDPNLEIDAPGGRFGSTPLFVACWRHNYDVASVLLQAGADPNIRDPGTGLNLFEFARSRRSLRDFLANVPNNRVDKRSKEGSTIEDHGSSRQSTRSGEEKDASVGSDLALGGPFQVVHSRYLRKASLQAQLERLFPGQTEFNIRMTRDLWCFTAPRKVEDAEIDAARDLGE